jgi:glycosyltransferase involved in cell wall biosynthesis
VFGFDEKGPPGPSGPAFHLDLTDVAAHAAISPSLTGIQRVQIECARALVQDCDNRAVAFANLNDVYVDLRPLLGDPRLGTVDAVFRRLRRLFGPASSLAFSRGAVADARSNSALKIRGVAARLRLGRANPRFGPSDRLFVGGAFWAHPRSVRTYEQAARDGCDMIVLLHDVLPLVRPDLADSGCRPLFERMLRLPGRVMTVSRHSQAEIKRARRVLGLADRAVTVTPLAHEYSAAPRNAAAREPASRRLAALDGAGPFALCVGSIEPRKNQGPLLELWRRLAAELGPGWPRLVVAGRAGWRAEETARTLKRADAGSPWLWIDGPSDEELAWLYGRACFTVFPSLAEGWGLPIGESLWFGKPCVASNAASMPEVGGALCAYGDPVRIDSFAEPIVRLVRDPGFYDASVAAIRASVLRTWRDTAEDLLQACAPRDR